MKKRKILKKFSLASLAVVMASAAIFAVIPIGASASSSPPLTTSGLGLDPKNDPVVYTTESGLQIKYGGIDVESSLSSGALKGYAYFTMGTYSNKPINWIIIGRNSNVSSIQNAITKYVFSNWHSIFDSTKFGKYYFENHFEAYSPAGELIESVISSNTYVQDQEVISFSSIPSNSEISSGCVLVLSEYVLTTSAFGNSGKYQGSTLKSVMDNLYTTNLSLTSSQKALIQAVSLKTWNHGSLATNADCFIFPLGSQKYNEESNYTMDENFNVGDYLTTNALRVGYSLGTTTATRWWFRSSHDTTSGYATFCETNGAYWFAHQTNTSHYATNSHGVRPAMVVKIS